MSGFKKHSQNFPVDPDQLFRWAVRAMEVPGDWSLQQIDEEKHYASATTKARFPAAPHLIQITVAPAKGHHTRELSTLTIKSRPKFGLGGGMDLRGVSGGNIEFLISQVVTWFNEWVANRSDGLIQD